MTSISNKHKPNMDMPMQSVAISLSEDIMNKVDLVSHIFCLKSRSHFVREAFAQFIADFSEIFTEPEHKEQDIAEQEKKRMKIYSVSLTKEEIRKVGKIAKKLGIARSDLARFSVMHLLYKLHAEKFEINPMFLIPESKKYELILKKRKEEAEEEP